jgi:hypothetical protein
MRDSPSTTHQGPGRGSILLGLTLVLASLLSACGRIGYDPQVVRDAGMNQEDAAIPLACPADCQHFDFACLCRNSDTGFNQAATICEEAGLRLARINSASENELLRVIAQSVGLQDAWIGASDQTLEGNWVWTDGTLFWSGGAGGSAVDGRFSSWETGQPNNAGGVENCSLFNGDGTWSDADCSEVEDFFCN